MTPEPVTPQSATTALPADEGEYVLLPRSIPFERLSEELRYAARTTLFRPEFCRQLITIFTNALTDGAKYVPGSEHKHLSLCFTLGYRTGAKPIGPATEGPTADGQPGDSQG